MSSFLILRALLFAGECVLASLLLPVLAFAATALLGRRAALRHLVWTTMFGVLAVLPLVALLLPPRLIVEHVAAPVIDALPMAVAAPLIAAPPPSLFTLENAVILLVGLWLAGLAWQLLRFIVGGLGLMRLRRASVSFASEIQTGCAVRLSGGESGPSTFGVLRPVILLPRSAQGWPAARLEAVLRHEAAHVARRDAASQLLARLVCVVYWINPLLWLAARALRRDAEIAADDAVLAGGMTPSRYAAELVRLAAESRDAVPGIAMAAPPLTQRVQSILETTTTRTGVSRMDIARTVCFGLTATLLLGVARFDLAMAQDAPVAPPVAQLAPASPGEAVIEAQVGAAAAETDRIKAQADRVTAQAKAKAAAETDPARRAQAIGAAAKVAAQSARVKAQADQEAALYAVEARKHMALAFQLADEVRQQAQDRQRLAEATPPSGGHAESSSSSESNNTVNGVTTVRRSHLGDGGDDNEAADARRDAMLRARDARRQAMKAMADAHIDQQVARAMADAHLTETIAKALADAHVDEVTRKAIADAHIEQRIAEAMARVQPKIDAAVRADAKMPAILPAPPLPSATTLPPVPPVPAQ